MAFTGHGPNKLTAFDADGGAPLGLPFPEAASGLKALGIVAPGVLWAGCADGKLVAYSTDGELLRKAWPAHEKGPLTAVLVRAHSAE